MLTNIQQLNLQTNIKKLWFEFEGPNLPKNQKRKQKDFAKLLNISEAYVSMLLSGERIGEKLIFRLSEVFGISTEDLISDNFDKIIDEIEFFKDIEKKGRIANIVE